MYRNKIILLSTLIGVLSFSNDSTLETKFNFELENGKDNKAKYDINAIKLNLELFKDVNLKFDLRSSRKNILESDLYDKSISYDKRRSHDIMTKIDFNYNREIEKDLNANFQLLHYIGNILHNTDQRYEYVNGEEKEDLGNTLIKGGIKGKYKETDLEATLAYKSKNLYRFDNNESYLKLDTKFSKTLNDNLDLSGKYRFNIDLDMLTRKMTLENLAKDEEELIESMLNKYVTKLTNDLNLEAKYKVREDLQFKYSLDLNIKNLLGKQESAKSYEIYDNRYNLSLKLGVNNKLGDFEFENTLDNKFEFRNIGVFDDYREKERGSLAIKNKVYKPTLDSKVKYTYNKDKLNLVTNLGFNYSPELVFSPYVVTTENMKHNLGTSLGLELKYDNLTVKFDNKLNGLFQKLESRPLKFTSNLSVNYSKDLLDNLKLSTSLKNTLTLNNRQIDNKLNEMKLKTTADLKLDYKILSNLSFSNKLSYEGQSLYTNVFNYYSNPKKVNKNESFGKLVYRYKVNSLEFNSLLEYTHELNKDITLKYGADFDAKLDLLQVKEGYVSTDTRPEEGQELVRTSNNYENYVNVGGHIKPGASIALNYKILNNLELNSGLKSSLVFERKVINKLEKENSLDNDLYGPIDKNFGFKKVATKLDLGLKYSW